MSDFEALIRKIHSCWNEKQLREIDENIYKYSLTSEEHEKARVAYKERANMLSHKGE